MRLEKRTVEEYQLQERAYKMGTNQQLVWEFFTNGYEVAEVIGVEPDKLKAKQANLKSAATSLGIRNVGVARRGNKLYLIRKPF